jgi:hypothetical protein
VLDEEELVGDSAAFAAFAGIALLEIGAGFYNRSCTVAVRLGGCGILQRFGMV